MLLDIVIIIAILVFLVAMHELGHFLFAKKFGVRVEEFGIGYPPRLFAKKIGETTYSLNLLPIGAFVRMPGENEQSDDPRSFSRQPVSKRIWIALGGVLSFWIIAVIILSINSFVGLPVAAESDSQDILNPRIQVAAIQQSSPAASAGLQIGDTVTAMKNGNEEIFLTKVSQAQSFIEQNAGKEITLEIKRNNNSLEIKITPRENPPQGEGPLGVALLRTGIVRYSWYRSLGQGFVETFNMTAAIFQGYWQAIVKVFQRVPTGVQLMGIVGVGDFLYQTYQLGVNYFLYLLGQLTIYLAIFNLLPIPALDGGKVLFLAIEAFRKKPVSQKAEQYITAFFFSLLIVLMIYVTIKDIRRIF